VDFAESEEHRALRAAVAEIAQDFGPRYYAERAAERRPCEELWTALGQAGFIGVNIPEAYGGGGGGLTELALVCEEIAAAGTPLLLLLVSAAISAGMISEFGTEEQRQAWLPGWPTARPRWCSRSPNRTPAPTRCGSPPPPPGTARTGC
jgi:alkylation response protein AidB-like acyl-CoA dehydrogenase